MTAELRAELLRLRARWRGWADLAEAKSAQEADAWRFAAEQLTRACKHAGAPLDDEPAEPGDDR